MIGSLRALDEELRERLLRVTTRRNEYGYDPFGADPLALRSLMLPLALVYRHWLRVETHGVERVPEGRVLLIGNHAGNTFAWDGAMLGMAMLLEAEPPRLVRGMGEYYLPQIPWFNVLLHRAGSVVGTPHNCEQLLENVRVIANQIAQKGPLALEHAKRLMVEGADLPLTEATAKEIECFTELFATDDRVEGMQAFLEKRAPTFTGA